MISTQAESRHVDATRVGLSIGTKLVASLICATVVAAVAAAWARVVANDADHRSISGRVDIVEERMTLSEDRAEDIWKVVVQQKDPGDVMNERARIQTNRLKRQTKDGN